MSSTTRSIRRTTAAAAAALTALGIAAAPGAGAATTTNDVATKAYVFFTQRGLTEVASAGILGNLQQESGFNTQASNGTHFGLAQWSGGRWSNENTYATSVGGDKYSADVQLDFIWQELNDGYTSTLSGLRSCSTAAGCADVFESGYERSGGSALGARESNANSWYAKHPVQTMRGVAAVYDSNGGAHAFAVNGAGRLVHLWRPAGTSGYRDLGTIGGTGVTLAGSPAVTFHDGHFDVWAIGTDGRVYLTVASSGGAFSTLAVIGVGSNFTGGLAAFWDGASYHLFGINRFGTAYHLTAASGGSWSNLGALGASGQRVTGSPAVSYHGGIWHLYAVGTNHRAYELRSTDSAWSVLSTGTNLIGGLADTYAGGSEHVYAANQGNNAYQLVGNTGSYTASSLGGDVQGALGSFWSGTAYEVLGVGTNDVVYTQTAAPGSAYSGWASTGVSVA